VEDLAQFFGEVGNSIMIEMLALTLQSQ